MLKPTLPALVLAFSFVGLAAPAHAQRSFVYRCQDGTQLTATFVGMKSARLQIGGRTLVLPIGRSGSGSRYVKGDTTFWIKGREATLERGRKSTTCVTD